MGQGAAGLDFHHAVLHGEVLTRVLSPEQHQGVLEFLKRVCIEWLDCYSCSGDGSDLIRFHAFMARLNSLAAIAENVGSIIRDWLSSGSFGRCHTSCLLLAFLLLHESENPFGDVLSRMDPDGILGDGVYFLRVPDCDSFCGDEGVWIRSNVLDLQSMFDKDQWFANLALCRDRDWGMRVAWEKIAQCANDPGEAWRERLSHFLELCELPPL